MPLMFSPVDPHTLYFATNRLFSTTTGGQQWEAISPDLSREKPEAVQPAGMTPNPDMSSPRGVIYSLAPSPLDGKVLWAGTDDGLIHRTSDGGKHWKRCTPPGLTSWSKIASLDAGRHDVNTVYAAVNRIKLDDMHPHIYRTHDGGKTWKEIVAGLPENGPANCVREDPVRPGLLVAGTERAVYISFDDGERWQSLRLNMPATSIRDLVIHDDDIVVATHGRSLWILDDITPLRQITESFAEGGAYLFGPQKARRVRWNTYTDTPLPPEEPAGENPPDGGIINYYIGKPATVVAIEITDKEGRSIRRFSSSDDPEIIDSAAFPHPTFWIRPPQKISTAPGIHRFVWDLHYSPPPGIQRSYPISAIYRNTAPVPKGPWIQPGDYVVHLTVDGRSYSRPLTVTMDPRVTTLPEALQRQFDASMRCSDWLKELYNRTLQIDTLRAHIASLLASRLPSGLKQSLESLVKRLDALRGSGSVSAPDPDYNSVNAASQASDFIVAAQARVLYLMVVLQSADADPTQQALAGVESQEKAIAVLDARWGDLKKSIEERTNPELRKAGHVPLTIP